MRRRGFTILELALVFGLVSILMTLVAVFFSRAQHYSSDTETYARVQREATSALRTITDDLYQGAAAWQKNELGSGIFLSARDPSGSGARVEFDTVNGKTIWKQWVGFYYDPATRTVLRANVPLVTESSETLGSPAPDVNLLYLQTQTGVERRAIARDVESFNMSWTGQGYRIEIVCSALSPVPRAQEADKLVEVRLTTEVNLLN